MGMKNFDSIYDSFEGVVCFFDYSDRIVYCNKEFAKTLRFSRNEVIGRNISDLLNPEERAEFNKNIYVKQQQSSMTLCFYQSSGAHVYLSLQAFKFADYYMILGTQIRRNYTSFDYNIIEDYLSLSNNKLKFDAEDILEIVGDNLRPINLVLNNLPFDLWIKDRHHRYVFMNDSLLLKMNLTFEQSYLKNDFEIFSQEVANNFVTSDLETIKMGKITHYTFESKNREFVKFTDVSKIPLYNKKSEFIGLIGSATDITTVKSREAAIQRENEVFIRILENLYDIVICINSSGMIEKSYGILSSPMEKYIGVVYQDAFSKQSALVKRVDEGFKHIESIGQQTLFGTILKIEVKPISVGDNLIKILVLGKEMK